MLEIGSDNIETKLDEWNRSYDLRKEFPFFRDYINSLYSSIF